MEKNIDIKNIDISQFKTIGKNIEKMEAISRPNLTYWRDAWRRIKQNKVAFSGLVILVVYIVLAIFGPIISQYEYTAIDSSRMNQFISSEHWFGTDELGRDLWTRVWRGARVSLAIGFIATILNTVIGGLVGGLSGYYGGVLDSILMRIIDILYGIPYLIVSILVMVVLGPGITSLIVAMVIVGWIGTARFVRGEVLKLKEQDFVAAAKILGVSDFTIIIKHILPNVMGLIITNLTMAVPKAIFNEAFLSYIGLGIAPPECSWGILAKSGVKMLRIYPYQLFIPSFFICTTMLALNLLGDGLRDALDPKLRGTE
ncbi:oligopeptide transport system permease protein [Sedimentibacter acidaminivorans]|uniref:Oligopeptide transport system permease protein n=1 Tax=Sedimentibacter acidaminivorans TaxID=913099 RepID=A0ABS4GD12_9FIRM|nr:ABC transporter permease [Sedimentibacter acidaminivorans]MBP1925532.1 oligopeptide transport system permease protein [Sedimentibacter acidaminivorans]